MNCVRCGGSRTASRENYRYTASGLSNVTLVDIEVRRCASCGDHEAVVPGVAELHRTIAEALVRRSARLATEEIRFLRKRLGFSGAGFARLVGVSQETVSRWENGKGRMSISAEKLLRMFVVHAHGIRDFAIESLGNVGEAPGRPAAKPLGLRIYGRSWVEQQLEAA